MAAAKVPDHALDAVGANPQLTAFSQSRVASRPHPAGATPAPSDAATVPAPREGAVEGGATQA